MNPSMLQRWVDEIQDTSRQQWLLKLVAVASPVGAVLAATAAHGRWWPIGLVLVSGLAAASAFRADTQLGVVVVGVVVWHWVATVNDPRTLWLPLAASLLLVFHSTIALSATVPVGGDLPSATLVGWLQRTTLVVGATVIMWLLVALFDRREAAGNGLLTALALATVAAAAVLIRSRSLGQPRRS